MAKLTARFDMQDSMSKKLKNMHGDLEKVGKARDRLNKPMTLTAKDKATRTVNKVNKAADKATQPKTIAMGIVDNITKPTAKINKYLQRKFPKTHSLMISVKDKASRQMKSINDYLKRRMPKTHEIVMRARDRTRTVLEGVNRFLKRKLLGMHMFEVMARDRATPIMHKIANYGRRALAKGYSFSVRAIDVATKTVSRIASYSGKMLPKYRDFTIRAIDGATRIVGSVKRALFSIPTAITVTLGVIGAGKLKDATVGAAMDFEGYQVATEHWLDGNKKKADDLVEWMRDYVNKTPFDSPDLFPALSRGIGVAEGDVKEAKNLLKIATDMAALTPNRTVEDAMEALADANMGEFQTLKSFNVKMTQDDFEGWDEFQSQMEDMFSGGAERFSQTSRGLFAKISGYITASFREAGEGMLESMKPRLDRISTWIDNNQDKWMEWRDTVQQMGEQGAEWVMTKLEKGFGHIQDNYLENDDFKKLDFEGKINFIMEDLGAWWDKTGQPLMVKISKNVGSAIFDGVVWGVKEGIKGIGNLWADAFKDPSLGNFATAGFATAIGMSVISLIASPIIKAFKIGGAIIRGALSAGRWIGSLFGRGKGPKGGPPIGGGSRKTKQPKAPKQGKPRYTNPWFGKGKEPKLNVPNASKTTGKLNTFSKILNKLPGKNLLKKVPLIGPAIGGLSLAAAPKDEKSGAAGSLIGGGAGAAIGSFIAPGIGTVIGGILGSMGGEWIGNIIDVDAIKEKFSNLKESISNTLFNGDWWGNKWESVKDWTSEKLGPIGETFGSIKDTISETLFSGDWWSEKWSTVKEIGSNFFSPDWWAEKAGFVTGYLSETLFNGDWWGDKWDLVRGWTAEKLGPIGEVFGNLKEKISETIFSGEWWSDKWGSVKEWTQEKWDSFQSVWESVTDKLAQTVFSSEWWGDKWGAVKEWTRDKWDSFTSVWNSITDKIAETVFSSEWWGEKWDNVKEWTSDKWDKAKSIWSDVKTSISEKLFNKDWWEGKWEKVSEWGKGVMSGIGGWVSDLIDDVKDSFGKGREKGKDAAKNRTASNHSTSSRASRTKQAPAYANGGLINKPHMGLIGEAGPEAIIPLSLSRRDRALDLYNQTGQMLGVRPYANGGIAGGSFKTSNQSVQASLNVDSVSVKGTDKEAEEYGKNFSTSVAEGINNKVVSIDDWKRSNIDNPMRGVVKEAVGFGSNTVNSFSRGQNATETHTNEHLNRQVKHPYEVIKGGAGGWGSGTVVGFRSGQNATETGTKPYLVSNVHTPFNQTESKGSGWGSGLVNEFVAGMRGKGAQVKESAKYLAEQVEKTFKKELGIHSPSRVMARLGEFASLGIVKGLSNVNIKKFAENQAGSLAAAFSGMGKIGGNVKAWIKAAMLATGAPDSWLAPLSTIAMKESGGKTGPGTVNTWDINAKRGTPSMGLMQTIGPTFRAHMAKGMGDIMNPIHNAAAAINYIKSRYGTPFNTPGIKSMAQGGPYKGYWKGTDGPLRSSETAWVGERGPELVNLPRGSEVYSNSDSKKIAANQVAAATGSGSKSSSGSSKIRDIIIQITGDNHFDSDSDMDKLTDKVKKVIEEVLDDEYNEGGELTVYG